LVAARSIALNNAGVDGGVSVVWQGRRQALLDTVPLNRS
jgi:hypothetical protein